MEQEYVFYVVAIILQNVDVFFTDVKGIQFM